MELPKHYKPEEVEEKLYAFWEEQGFFNPETCIELGVADSSTEPFSIVLPPPNVTGVLHMGHAAMLAVEDIAVRYARMKGRPTLWIPGTDHAAIATQSKVEGLLYKEEGKTKHDLRREEFLGRVHAFAQDSHDTIVRQIKRMGASLDWSREAYTLDQDRVHAVNEAFKRMYELGLIYRGHRIVNWDPNLQTTVSDDEIEWKEETVPFYYLQYGPFVIGTARPETKFGDKHVVMHPADERYKEYQHGQELEVEWINGTVKATVIKDEAVDPEFGSGVMTITPWHDATDFEIASRHSLEKEQIIGLDGKLLSIAQEFTGMHIKKARHQIVEKLKEKGLLVKTDDRYVHRIATNSRGGGMIEPQVLEQWFVAADKPFVLKESKIQGIPSGSETTLKELMRKAVETGQIQILPERFEKNYYHWIDNLRDWCISRQIWFGHRVPVWYKDGEVFVGEGAPGPDWKQDPDTLDTWFSSGLWTFSTLGWPKLTQDLKTYHPTFLLETGYDILFFWVARMILMTGCLLGDIPFRTVYLHGLVRDEKGKKMSKSLGNIIDPLDMIEKYGADATRLSLIVGVAPGSDSKLSEDKVRGYKYFTNKLWNIARFILLQIEDYDASETPNLGAQDKEILEQFEKTAREVTEHIEAYRFYLAADALYHYLWHTFADKTLEDSKVVLKDVSLKPARQYVLLKVLGDSLKLLHPFTPFVTEEIYQKLPIENKKASLMIEPWPVETKSDSGVDN